MIDVNSLITGELPKRLPVGFLGKLVQVSMVTRDIEKTIAGLRKLGIGPWRTYRFDRDTCLDLTYMGAPADFAFVNALADLPGFMWELIQPLEGKSIYTDFLETNGEGLHHLLFDCNKIDWATQNAALVSAGYQCIQSGKWGGIVHFAYYSTGNDGDIIIEIMNVGEGWKRPVPLKVYE